MAAAQKKEPPKPGPKPMGFYFYVTRGEIARVQAHLERVPEALNKKISTRAYKGIEAGSPLQLAARSGQAALMAWLLAQGADTAIRGKNGNTLLHEVLRGGNMACLHLLFKLDIDVEARNDKGETARECAILHGHSARKIDMMLAQLRQSHLADAGKRDGLAQSKTVKLPKFGMK